MVLVREYGSERFRKCAGLSDMDTGIMDPTVLLKNRFFFFFQLHGLNLSHTNVVHDHILQMC